MLCTKFHKYSHYIWIKQMIDVCRDCGHTLACSIYQDEVDELAFIFGAYN